MGLFCVLLHPRQLHSQVTPPSDPPTLALSLVQGRRAFWALSSRGKFYTWRFLGEWSRSRCRAGDMKRRMKVTLNQESPSNTSGDQQTPMAQTATTGSPAKSLQSRFPNGTACLMPIEITYFVCGFGGTSHGTAPRNMALSCFVTNLFWMETLWFAWQGLLPVNVFHPKNQHGTKVSW